MDISSTTSSGPSTKKPPRNRLNHAGKHILEAYWENNPKVIPSLEVRKSLLQQIKKCGNEFYESPNIVTWFRARVKALSEPVYDSQSPSLTKSALDHLEVLIKNTQSPSSDVIETWAALLRPSGAKREDVINWVHSRARGTRLPTPANTATPDRSPSLPSSSLNGKLEANHDDDAMNVDTKPPVTLLSITTKQATNTRQPSSFSAGTSISPVVYSTSPAIKFHYEQGSGPPAVPLPISPTSPTFAASNLPFRAYPNQNHYQYQQGPPAFPAVPLQNLPVVSMPPSQSQIQAINEANHNNMRKSSSSAVSPVSRSSHSLPQSPVSHIVQQQDPPRPKMSLLQAIVQGVADAAGNPSPPPEAVPSSPAEYEAMFAPYAERMSHLMQILEKS